MKLISWNVAGFRSCLKKGFENFFDEVNADIFCLQEVKALENDIDFNRKEYFEYLNPADKKGYSGTLVYTKIKPNSVRFGLGIDEFDHEGRVITLEYKEFYLVNIYTPNSKRELLRLDYRMRWEDEFLKYIKNLEKNKPVIICGDLNVAHKEIDIKNAKQNERSAGFTIEERNKFSDLLASGFIDTYRHFYPDKVIYTWWSYLFKARERDAGWRLDYFVISKSLKSNLKSAEIYSNVLGSDHCPIGIEILF